MWSRPICGPNGVEEVHDGGGAQVVSDGGLDLAMTGMRLGGDCLAVRVILGVYYERR